MKVAVINATFGQVREVKPTTSQHLWYDQDAEWLISTTCGKLTFTSENGRTKIKPAESTKITYTTQNDYEKIMGWFRLNSSDLHLEIVEAGVGVVAFAFPDESQNAVEDALSYNRFDYEIF